jgi:hypothetical protein
VSNSGRRRRARAGERDASASEGSAAPTGAPPNPSPVTSSFVPPTLRRFSVAIRRLPRDGRAVARVVVRRTSRTTLRSSKRRTQAWWRGCPDHQVVLRPAMGIDELGLGGVLHQVADAAIAWVAPTDDGSDVSRQEKRLALSGCAPAGGAPASSPAFVGRNR